MPPPTPSVAPLKILVTSRKGGVGKSTISANLAAYFKMELGLTTTLLDLDLHGSSSDWLREARPVGVVVQHHPLPLDLGRRGAALDARRYLRHAAESSDVVVADLTWSDALDGNWLFDYDLVLTPVSMSGIEVAATIGFLSNLHWVFESTVRTPPQLMICPSRVESTDSMRDVFTSQTFPIGFILSPPVLNFPQAKQLFKKGYLCELPDPAGASFKVFAKSVADVGMAHVRYKTSAARAGIHQLSRMTGASDVLNGFMQQRGHAANYHPATTGPPRKSLDAEALPETTPTTPATTDAAHPSGKPDKRSLLQRIFGSNAKLNQ